MSIGSSGASKPLLQCPGAGVEHRKLVRRVPEGGSENFIGMCKTGGSESTRKGQRLVIGPWLHFSWNRKVGALDFSPEAANPIDRLHLRWFDFWLKGQPKGVDTEKPVRVFVMGANIWREADDWPIPGTRFAPYYLPSMGQAKTRYGNGSLAIEKPTADQAPATTTSLLPLNHLQRTCADLGHRHMGRLC